MSSVTVSSMGGCHSLAQMAGRSSVELHTLIFFRGRTVVADARITKVHSLLDHIS